MNSENKYHRLAYWIEQCQSKGMLAFSIEELRRSFPSDTDTGLKRMLDRLTEKKKVLSIFKGYYIIIPAQYLSKGILPTVMFIDGLMNFLSRKYYVALLNAAVFHGASHQQPQEFFIVTSYPVLRSTNKKGLKVNYISTRRLPPESLIEKKKTETGYIYVSNPMLTAIDLIYYEKKIGGLNRASTVINELTETIKPRNVSNDLIAYANTSSLQRLGFILEEVLEKKDIADQIFILCKKAGIKFYLIPLKASGKKDAKIVSDRWKLMINAEIEIDI